LADIIASHVYCVYSPGKMGKTLDCGLSFPKGVFFAPSKSSIAPLLGLGGFTPKHMVVANFEPVLKFVREHQTDTSVGAVVVDDLALISDRAVREWDGQSKSAWGKWNALDDVLHELTERANASPWQLVLTTHETKPTETPKTWIPGGPKMPSKGTTDYLGKTAGCILRARAAVSEEDHLAAGDWPVVYSCDRSDPGYIVGDRNGLALRVNPLNLREILHTGGIDVPRLFEWQEEQVEKLSQAIIAGTLDGERLDAAIAELEKLAGTAVHPDRAVDWTLRDARARAWLATHHSQRRGDLRAAILKQQGRS
jgi:hypothetical protein